MDSHHQISAIKILLDNTNLITLSPVFPSILRLIRGIYEDLDSYIQDFIDNELLHLFQNDSYLTKIELNVNYMIQILSMRHSYSKESIFINLYDAATNHLLRRQIIIAMSNWDCHYWLIDIKSNFSTLSMWERRAFIFSSYVLGDEGQHWREHNKKRFTIEENLIKEWFSKKSETKQKILV